MRVCVVSSVSSDSVCSQGPGDPKEEGPGEQGTHGAGERRLTPAGDQGRACVGTIRTFKKMEFRST